MTTSKKALTAASLACLAIGCSSSGGDSSPTASVPRAEINSQNAPVIAGAVSKSAVEGSDLGAFAGMTGGAGTMVGDTEGQVLAKVGTIQSSSVQALRDRALFGELQALIPAETTECAVSGTVEISGNVASPLTLSAGDTFTLVFDSCDDGAGVVNGTYAMLITSFTGDLIGGSFSLGVSITLTGFGMIAEGQLVTINGSISVSMTTSASPTQTISISSASLTISDGTSSHTLMGYSAIQSIDQFTGAYTLEISGTLTSSAFAGSVSFGTSVELVGDGSGHAFAGEIRITGAQSATIQIIVLDGDLVRLDIDLDGDGVIDEIIDTSWAELLE